MVSLSSFRLPFSSRSESSKDAIPQNEPRSERNGGPSGQAAANAPLEGRPRVNPRTYPTSRQKGLLDALRDMGTQSGGGRKLKKKPPTGQTSAHPMVETHRMARPSTPKLLKPFRRQLKSWVQTPGLDPEQRKARSLAAKRIQGWVDNRKADKRWDDVLGLPGFGLSSIPPLPKGVRSVDLSGNKMTVLTGLQDLPKSLTTLDLSGNPFEQVEMSGFILKNRRAEVKLGATNLGDDTRKLIETVAPNLKFGPAPANLARQMEEWATRERNDQNDFAAAARRDLHERFMQANSAGNPKEPVPPVAVSGAPGARHRDDALAAALKDWANNAEDDQVAVRVEILHDYLHLERGSTSEARAHALKELSARMSAFINSSPSAGSSGSNRPGRSDSAPSGVTTAEQLSARTPARASRSVSHAHDSSSPASNSPASTLARLRASQSSSLHGASLPSLRRSATASVTENSSRDVTLPEARWGQWAARQSEQGGRGGDAVNRIRNWVNGYRANPGHADIPLDLSELGLNELPPELPEGLQHLRFHGNKLTKVPPLHSLPERLRTLDVDGNPIEEFSDDSLNKNRGGLVITIDDTFLMEGEDEAFHFDQSRKGGPKYLTPQNAFRNAMETWCSLGSDDEVASRIEASDRINRHIIANTRNRESKVPLDLSGLGLTSIPPLPRWIKAVNFDNNRLPEIPPLHDLPPKVDLSLLGNPIAGLPENFMTTYSAHSDVHISMRPDLLPPDTLAALQRHIAQADYAGPKISFATAYDRNEAPEPAGAKSVETQDPPARQRPPRRPMGPRPMPPRGENFSNAQASLGELIGQFPKPPSNGRLEVQHPKIPRTGSEQLAEPGGQVPVPRQRLVTRFSLSPEELEQHSGRLQQWIEATDDADVAAARETARERLMTFFRSGQGARVDLSGLPIRGVPPGILIGRNLPGYIFTLDLRGTGLTEATKHRLKAKVQNILVE